MKKFYLLMLLASIGLQGLFAANVKVTMNAVAKVMTLTNKATSESVEVGTATSYVYTFDVDPGTYVLKGWSSDAHTQDYGTIELTVTDEATQEFKVFTITAQCQSYYADTKTGWAYGTDWTIADLKCNTRDGQQLPITLSDYTLVNTSGNKYQYKYFLTLSATSYSYRVAPSADKKAEGYTDAFCGGTVTANANSSFTIPKGGTFTATFPSDADFDIWQKPGGTNGAGSVHYVAFTPIKPLSVASEGGNTVKTYALADGTTYNYRLWKEDKRTKAGTFVYYIGSASDGKIWDAAHDGMQSFTFTDADLAQSSKWMNTDVSANNKANVANILLNINERGHLRMKSGETKNLMAQRDWQLTNSSTGNYFIEPEYHYTVLNLDGTMGNDVVTVNKPLGLGVTTDPIGGSARSSAWENAAIDFSPWAELKANKPGSALVLVSYDAINVSQWTRSGSGTAAKPYTMAETAFMQGAEWSALWPENTAAFIVTVDDNEPSFDTKMIINEAYNTGALKNAGQYVDAEHDVFYYLDTEAGYSYTFAPEGVATIEIAYPTLTETSAKYTGFATEGVTKNADGTYTLLLKKGRQIVRLTGEDGTVAYQVLTAKPCTQTITNKTHTDGKYYPGDELEIQFAGLYHPANKMAGIYNMSAFVTYKGVPNGTEVTQTGNQYAFAGTTTAQLVKTRIPANWNTAEPFVMDDGVIQVSGFGDPIGNHRFVDKVAGRSPNFAAISHQTYFGALPEVRLTAAEPEYKAIEFKLTPSSGNSQITLVNDKGDVFTPNTDGAYKVIPGSYTYTIITEGYKYVTNTVTITGDETEAITIDTTLVAIAPNGWDGISVKEPEVVTAEEAAQEGGIFYGMEGYYKIQNGYNLAWVAENVNVNKVAATNAVLCNDITLSDMPWTTIGNSTSTAYKGNFEGNNHTISGISIEGTKTYTNGLFGYCDGITLRNLTVEGNINTTATYPGIVNRLATSGTIYNVTSKLNITMTGTGSAYAGGIVGWLVGANGAQYSIERCSFEGTIDVGTRNNAAGIVGYNTGNYDNITINNCYVGGTIKGGNNIAGVISVFGGDNSAKAKIANSLIAADITGTGASVGSVWSGNYTATGIDNTYTSATEALTNNQGTLKTAQELASGEVAYLLNGSTTEGDLAWGQYIGSDATPVLGGRKIYVTTEEELTTYSNNNSAYDDLVNFEDTGLDVNSTYDGSDEAGFFTSGDYYFMNYYDTTYGSWNGFALSSTGSNQFNDYADQYNSVTGGGHESNTFAVGYFSEFNYWTDFQAPVITADRPFKADYCYITNTANAVKSMLNGDDYAKKFTADDWLKLTISSLDEDMEEVASLDFYLAKDGNILTDWQQIDLTPLGMVNGLQFTMDSSDKSWGFMNTPAYFCLDNMKMTLAQSVTLLDGEETIDELYFMPGDTLLLPTPEKKGHTFRGWNTELTHMPTSDLTLSAQYETNSYAITFLGIDNDTIKSDTLLYGASIVYPKAPEVEGHTFNSWSEDIELVPDSNLTIQALYDVNQYRVTFLTADADTIQSSTLLYGTTIEYPIAPEREGYTFNHWDSDILTVPANDVTISPLYDTNSYALTFIGLNNDTIQSDTLLYATSITYPEAPTLEGYTFLNWDAEITTMPAQDVTINALYEINKHQLTFIGLNNDTIQTDTVAFGTTIEYPTAPEEEGHTFSQWSETITQMPDADVTITAQYTVNTYLITFTDANGDTISTQTMQYGQPLTYPEAPEKEGYTFREWSISDTTVPSHAAVITPLYDVNTYTITYLYGDSIVNTIQVDYGELLPDYTYTPENVGNITYTFEKWQLDNETDITFTLMPARDLTLHAVVSSMTGLWSANAHGANTLVDVYTTSGKLLRQGVEAAHALDNLPQGIYIVGGKTVRK